MYGAATTSWNEIAKEKDARVISTFGSNVQRSEISQDN
jgi:hypothetical protein